MDEKTLKPQLRFKEFSDAWEQRKLGDTVRIRTGFPFDSSKFANDGEFLVITNGNIKDELSDIDNSLGNRINIQDKQIKQEYELTTDDILVTMDGTVGRTAKVVDSKQILAQRVGRLTISKNKEFFYQALNTGSFFKEMCVLAHGGTIKHISLSEIGGFEFSSPPKLEEQQKIGTFFSNLDNLITLHQRKLDKLGNMKKALLEKMFPKNDSNMPEIRFKGFSDAWEQRKLSECAEIIGGGTPSTSISEYWNGNIDWYAPAEMEGKRYADGSVKKITDLGLKNSSARMLPENKTILFTSRAGIGKMSILLKPACTNQGFQSLILKDDIVPYFIYSMESKIKNKAERIAAGSTFLEISGKLLGSISFHMPKHIEQQKIGTFFSNLDNLITLHQRKLEKLKNIKKSCLDKMFV